MPVNNQMKLIDNILGFQGKANRMQYTIILMIAIGLIISGSIFSAAAATIAICTALILIIPASIRRLHDINVSAW